MFAVIKTGGKQYKVAKDDVVTVERLEGAAGDMVLLDEVLMLGGEDAAVEIGAPRVDGARVSAEVVDQPRGDKIVVFKKKRRQNYRRKKGHRQDLTQLRILEILTGGAEPSVTPAAKPAKKPKAPKAASEEAPDAAKAAAEEGAPAAGAEPTLLKAPKGEADDLTKITGLGPKLAEKLNETGIYHFWQIAEWTPAQVDWLDDQLKIKGRVEKDDWVAQAKELAKG